MWTWRMECQKINEKCGRPFWISHFFTCHSVACCSVLTFSFKEHICLFLFSRVILYPYLKLHFHSKEFGNTYRYIFSKSVHNHLKVCFWVFLLEYILNDFLIDVYSNIPCIEIYNVEYELIIITLINKLRCILYRSLFIE